MIIPKINRLLPDEISSGATIEMFAVLGGIPVVIFWVVLNVELRGIKFFERTYVNLEIISIMSDHSLDKGYEFLDIGYRACYSLEALLAQDAYLSGTNIDNVT